jgi:hypothetical protein
VPAKSNLKVANRRYPWADDGLRGLDGSVLEAALVCLAILIDFMPIRLIATLNGWLLIRSF